MKRYLAERAEDSAALFLYASHLFPLMFIVAALLMDRGGIVFLPLLFFVANLLMRWIRALQARFASKWIYLAGITALQAALMAISPRPALILLAALSAGLVGSLAWRFFPGLTLAAFAVAVYGLNWLQYFDMVVLILGVCLPFWLCMAWKARRLLELTGAVSRGLFLTAWATATVLLWTSTRPAASEIGRVIQQPAVDTLVRFDDPNRPAEIRNTNTVRYAEESCDPRYLLISSRNGLQSVPSLVAYDTVGKRVVRQFPGGASGDSFALDCASGRLFLPDIHRHVFWVLDEETFAPLARIPAHRPLHAFYAGGAETAILVDEAGQVLIVGTDNRVTQSFSTRGERIKGATRAPDGRFWLTVGSSSELIEGTDSGLLSPGRPLGNDMFVLLDSCHPTPRLVAAHMMHGRVSSMSLPDLREVATALVGRGGRFLRCDSESDRLFVLNHFSGELEILRLQDLRETGRLYLGRRGHQITLSHDRRFLYAVTSIGVLRVGIGT